MNNVIKFVQNRKSSDVICEEACTWLARIDAGISSEDRALLDSWLSRDSRNSEMLMEMAVLWDQLSVLSELSDVFPLNSYNSLRRRYSIKKVFATAAAVMLCFLSLGAFLIMGDDIQTNLEMPPLSYETEIGEQRTVTLPDNSTIILNTNTELEIAYTKLDRRVILLRGEGLFTVAKDASRPFRVYTENHVVEAVGTAFTVQRKADNNVEVLVTEGKVNLGKLPVSTELSELRNYSEEVLISDIVEMSIEAGELAATSPLDTNAIEKVLVAPGEIEVRLAWQNGMLLFQGKPLSQVLEEVSRYTTIRIEADESIQEILVQGYFRAGDINGLLVAMERNFKISANRVSENYIRLSLNNN